MPSKTSSLRGGETKLKFTKGDSSAGLVGLALLKWCAESDTGTGQRLAAAAVTAMTAALAHYKIIAAPKDDEKSTSETQADKSSESGAPPAGTSTEKPPKNKAK